MMWRLSTETQTATRPLRLLTATAGLLAVTLFCSSFLLLGIVNPNFDLASDFISKLGTAGQPYAVWWNLTGFAAVGLSLAIFGWCYGLCRRDRVLGACLLLAGVGFALSAIPTDFSDAQTSLSKAHFVSVCLALAGYCLALARLTSPRSAAFDQNVAKALIALSVLPLCCVSVGVSAEPVAHRAILGVAFTWVTMSSIQLLRADVPATFE